MESTLLKKNELAMYIAGSEYNFRQQIIGDGISEEITRALKTMGIQPEAFYSGQQVHGDEIAYADGVNGDPFIFGKIFPETDGLLTDRANVALLVKYADCTPIVLFDPNKKVVAALHSGWRSTVQRISQKAIRKMVEEFDCDINGIVAYLGPSIDQEHYEVGPEVYEAFVNFPERDSFFETKGDKYLLSMSDANKVLLREAGLKEDNIEVSRDSTFTHEQLHSSRAEGKTYGLNGLIVMMDEESDSKAV